jgi:addiction module HigA family antidote
VTHRVNTPTLSAYQLGVSTPTVAELVAHRRNVSAQMALRLARYFGTSAQVWQNLQAQYDLEVAISKIGKAVTQKIRPRTGDRFVDP